MSHPRSLTDEEAIAAEQWFQDYERVGTLAAKAKSLGVTRWTVIDAIRRVRGQDTRQLLHKVRKLSAHDIDALANEILGGSMQYSVTTETTLHVEHLPMVEEDDKQFDK